MVCGALWTLSGSSGEDLESLMFGSDTNTSRPHDYLGLKLVTQ